MTTAPTPTTTTYLYTGDGLGGSHARSPGQRYLDPAHRHRLHPSHRRRLPVSARASAWPWAPRVMRPLTTARAGRPPPTPTRRGPSTRCRCASSTFCVAVDTSGYATTYNGTAGPRPTDIDSTRALNAVTAPAPPSVWRSVPPAMPPPTTAQLVDGLRRRLHPDPRRGVVYQLELLRGRRHLGLCRQVHRHLGHGHRHRLDPQIDTMDCPETTLCVAAGASGYATTYNGSSLGDGLLTPTRPGPSRRSPVRPPASVWRSTPRATPPPTTARPGRPYPIDIDGSNALEALSCASATMCDANDNAGNALTYNGSSWSVSSNIDSTRSITAVSCPSTTFCAAADGSGMRRSIPSRPAGARLPMPRQ